MVQAPEAWAAARRANEAIQSGIVSDMSQQEAQAYLEAVGAIYGLIRDLPPKSAETFDASSVMNATVDQRRIAPGPLVLSAMRISASLSTSTTQSGLKRCSYLASVYDANGAIVARLRTLMS
jgi:hypothetical protein